MCITIIAQWYLLLLSYLQKWKIMIFNPLNTNPTKWSNTLKQFVGKLPTNWLSVFDHFVKLALKALSFSACPRQILDFARLNLIFYYYYYYYFEKSDVKYIETKSQWVSTESVFPVTTAGVSKCQCACRAQPGKSRIKKESIMIYRSGLFC